MFRKNICILIDGISNSGGTDRVASSISDIFSQLNYRVSIYSLNEGAPFYEINNNVNIFHSTSNNRCGKLKDALFHIKQNNYDSIIIISMGRLSAQIIPLLRFFRVNSSLICSDHVSIESFPFYIRYVKYIAYYLADKVLVLTEHDKKLLTKCFSDKKIYVVRNASPFPVETNSEKTKLAIAVGRLTYQKNFQRLLSIWEKSQTDDWELVIIGSGDELDILHRIISAKALKNVKIIPPNKNLIDWYRKASVLLMTSRYEGLPMVLIEAKSFGLPVIAFDCKTGPSEIIQNDGFVIEYDSDNEFVIKLENIIHDEHLRLALSLNAKKNAGSYSKLSVAKIWENII